MSVIIALTISFLGVFSACKSREEDPNSSATVQFKVTATNNVDIKAIVTQVGTEQTSNYNVNGTSWSSDAQIINTSLGAVHLSSTALGEDSDSKLITSIYVNGTLKASDTAQGVDLMAKTMVDLRP